MNEIDKEYEARVLQMVINQYLSEIVDITEQNLESIEANKEQIVWDVCTKIYHNSGYKVNFSIIRDVIDFQLALIKNQKIEKAAKQAALLEETTKQALLDLEEIVTKTISQCLNITYQKAAVFLKIRTIISEFSDTEEEEISLETAVFAERAFVGGGFSSEPLELCFDFSSNSSYRCFLGVEWDINAISEAQVFLLTLEEEFNIEIPDSDAKYLSTVDKLVNYILEILENTDI